jgi:transcriptional regulator with GAF, ATPase, and Fis domain
VPSRTIPAPPLSREERTDATHATSTTSSTGRDEKAGYALLVSSEDDVAVIRLDKPSVVVGRGSECDVQVDDSSISRRHARLVVADTITLEDLGSTNGTRVQGTRLERGDRAELSLGTVFELGSATFVLQRARGLAKPLADKTRRTVPPRAPESSQTGGPIIVDPTMRHLYALLDVISPSPLNVLVLGETGVGKEVFADAIHRRSERSDKRLLTLNCGALPQTTLEGELFGYERGAFTGAVQAKQGLFESADGGTVFLDEIGEMPMETQAKLLRVLESGEVLRLGSLAPRRVDVRFIAATNRDLRKRIVEGTFRADLYFRLDGMTVTLPPLRKRQSEIGPLARHFLEKIATRLRRAPPVLTDAAVTALERHTWPGNARELRNVLERAFVLASGNVLDAKHFEAADPDCFGADDARFETTTEVAIPIPAPRGGLVFPSPDSDSTLRTQDAGLREALRGVERQHIQDALVRSGGNQTEAAKLLGISRYTLMARMETFGIARPRKSRKGV